MIHSLDARPIASDNLRSFRLSLRPFAAVAALSAALGAVACDDRPVPEYRIGSATYAFPPEHVASARTGPELFVRLQPGETAFELVHDGASAGRTDEHGRLFVFSVSDGDRGSVQQVHVNGITLLCRAAANPRSDCGVAIEANGAVWSVLIPPARVRDVEQLVKGARAKLESYRVR